MISGIKEGSEDKSEPKCREGKMEQSYYNRNAGINYQNGPVKCGAVKDEAIVNLALKFSMASTAIAKGKCAVK